MPNNGRTSFILSIHISAAIQFRVVDRWWRWVPGSSSRWTIWIDRRMLKADWAIIRRAWWHWGRYRSDIYVLEKFFHAMFLICRLSLVYFRLGVTQLREDQPTKFSTDKYKHLQNSSQLSYYWERLAFAASPLIHHLHRQHLSHCWFFSLDCFGAEEHDWRTVKHWKPVLIEKIGTVSEYVHYQQLLQLLLQQTEYFELDPDGQGQ